MNCQFAPLPHEALLHINGPDSLKFLQGQTTCDTRKVNPNNAAIGAFCTPQGRVICDFLLCELGPEHFALRLRREIRERSAAAFGKYIIFSKAKLDPGRDNWQCIAVWGEESAAALREVFAEVPAARLGAVRAENHVLVQTDTAGQAFECYLYSAHAEPVLARLATLMSLGTEADWRAQQIAAGIARVETATVEEFVPQALNFDLIGAISFNKGCYTGQEVVARLHYRGKAKRRTHLFECAGLVDYSAGAPLYSSASQQSVGHLVNISHRQGKSLLLATCSSDALMDELHLGAVDGPLLTRAGLPYAVASD